MKNECVAIFYPMDNNITLKYIVFFVFTRTHWCKNEYVSIIIFGLSGKPYWNSGILLYLIIVFHNLNTA